MTDYKLDAQTARTVGQSLTSQKLQSEITATAGYLERLEWVRQSYERFLAKIIEKEALVQAPPADIG